MFRKFCTDGLIAAPEDQQYCPLEAVLASYNAMVVYGSLPKVQRRKNLCIVIQTHSHKHRLTRNILI